MLPARRGDGEQEAAGGSAPRRRVAQAGPRTSSPAGKTGRRTLYLPLASEWSGGDRESSPVFIKSERLSCPELRHYLHLCAMSPALAGDPLGPFRIRCRRSVLRGRAAHVLGPICL